MLDAFLHLLQDALGFLPEIGIGLSSEPRKPVTFGVFLIR